MKYDSLNVNFVKFCKIAKTDIIIVLIEHILYILISLRLY